MQFYTLNQILNLIQSISEGHAQVKGYNFGEDFDISASAQQKYPLVWANVGAAELADKTLTIPIDVAVYDIVQDSNRNEKDTLSDTLSIAQDLIAQIKDPAYQDYFEIDGSVSLEPVRHILPDVVNGWRFTIKFEVASTSNRCQVPTT